MEKKKVLKDKPGYKDVFLGDDLTPLRARLRKMVKGLSTVDKVWVTGGRIKCTLRQIPGQHPSQQRTQPYVIETPDDLFKLGLYSVDYTALGLSHLMCRP